MTSSKELEVAQLDVCGGVQMWLRSVRLACNALFKFWCKFPFLPCWKQDDLVRLNVVSQSMLSRALYWALTLWVRDTWIAATRADSLPMQIS